MGGDPVPTGYLHERAPVLLRLAHQLTGDPAAAYEAVYRAAARLRDRTADLDLDRRATAELVRVTRRWEPASTGTDLDWLTPRARAAVVLAFGLGWDPEGIAEVTRRPSQQVRRDVARALRQRSEEHWRSLLEADRWAVPVADDLVEGVAVTRRRTRSRHNLTALTTAIGLTFLAAVSVATVRVADRPPPLPPTADAPGLLSWTPRGSLIRDRRFVADAMRVWQRVAPPTGGIYVLWAGRIGVGRAAVLQASLSDGDGLLALVADHDITYNRPRLRLEGVWPISDPDGPAVVVPYDGNLGIPGLATGPGSRVVQLLVAPGVEGVETRAPRDVGPTRPGFETKRLTDGMTSPWLDLTDSTIAAVRLYRADGSSFVGLLPDGGIQLAPMRADVAPQPPPPWSGLDTGDPRLLADDAIWWAQTCRSPDADVQIVWQRRVPAFPAPVRLEFVTCPDGPPVAAFLTGVGSGTQSLTASTRPADAYRVDLVPPGGGPASVAIVGSDRVTVIRGHDVVVRDRVAVLPIDQVVGLRVLDGTGRVLTLG
ncbi:MAG TPA: hypothetical protein VFJ98_04815 [Mycobacteriales bacterium]|nr:hypothetical protein [Mycobacteriales bacterium]